MHQKREIRPIFSYYRRGPGVNKPCVQWHHGESYMIVGVFGMPHKLRKVDESVAPPMKVGVVKHKAGAEGRRSPVDISGKLFQEVEKGEQPQPESAVEVLIDRFLL